VAKTLTGAYFHDGTWSSFRRRHHGRPVDTASLPGWTFLGYLQDHDQIGNRAVGDRISASLSPGLLAVGATVVLTSPFTPMLFMGEEWGASTPWQFFTSHTDPEIGRATAEGRKGEFAEHGWDADEVPDPQDPETFTRSKLDWSELEQEPHVHLLAVHKALIALRRAHPDLVDPDLSAVEVSWDDADRWLVVHRGSLRVVANLADRPREVHLDRSVTDVLFSTGELPQLDGTTVTVPAESAAVLTTA
jgi:maltooligosyltrehalose trehalohydrolase